VVTAWQLSTLLRCARVAAGLVVAASALRATPARAESALAELIHLVPASAGTPAPTYTLADETRPRFAGPVEATVSLLVPPTAGDTLPFDVPSTITGSDAIVTGLCDRNARALTIVPQHVRIADENGARRASIAVPAIARGPGQPAHLTLTLAIPPAADVIESEAPVAKVPEHARLELAYGLSDAARLPGGKPVTFEVATRESPDHALWTATIDPGAKDARGWHEATVAFDALAGRAIRLVFRARSADRQTLFPLWADPTIVAPAPRPPARRNVVLISIDTLRADRLGVYGSYRPTSPAIDAFAKGATLFEEAWSVWPETSGSHMSIFTSRFPSEHGVTSFIQTPPPSMTLLAEHLRSAGYLTRAFTEDGGVWANAGFARGFAAYGERRSLTGVYGGEAAATFGDATRWLEAHRDRSFFLFVHTYQVHAPYTPPRSHRLFFLDIPGREGPGFTTNALAYDQEMRFTDDQVGPFLAAIERAGLGDRTIVVLLSDHGEEFGEHGGMGHGRTLYREVLQVPLIVWAPGLAKPERIATPASLLDVAPTVLDLLGLPPDPAHDGTSLAAAIRGATAKSPAPRPIFGEIDRDDLVAHDHVRAVSARLGGRAAIANLMDGTTRCYAADDPREQKPQQDCGALTDLLAGRREALVRARPSVAATPAAVDPRTVEKMRALGYVQ
jgi:arylsulfatase A-like enzyme